MSFRALVIPEDPTYNGYILMPDRDGKSGAAGGENRVEQIAALETHARDGGRWLLGCAAIEEIEVWLMGGHPEKLGELGIGWKDVREEPKPSVGSFVRFLDRFGDQSVGRGRQKLMVEACRSLRGLLDRCEELKVLVGRLRAGDGRPPRA